MKSMFTYYGVATALGCFDELKNSHLLAMDHSPLRASRGARVYRVVQGTLDHSVVPLY